MAFPPQFLDEIRARVPLSSVVGRKVKLTRAGREWRSPCPFHKEKTPSFYVNDQKSFFHCFGCGAHGDAVGFLMRHDNLSFLESVELLAAEAGLEVPKPTEAERHRYEAQKTQHEILEAATSWFEEQLRKPAGRKALEYLHGRGLDDQAIAQFRLGYAPADAQAIKAALVTGTVKESDLIELGLVKQSEDGSRSYAFFRDRAIFPVTDRQSRPIAFGARLLDGDGPKYINSPEHPLFHKGETVYSIARARLAAADGQPIIIVEGYMDVIALVRAGYLGAVAPMGTAITEFQIETLWRLIPTGMRVPILCLDGDKAGQKAAERAMARVLPILKPDHSLRIAFMPTDEDPDSLIKSGGRSVFETILQKALPLSEFLWLSCYRKNNWRTPEEAAGLGLLLNQEVGRIQNRDVFYLYRQFVRKRLREVFTKLFDHHSANSLKKREKKAGAPPIRLIGVNKAIRAKIILIAVMHNPDVFEEMEEQILTYPMPSDVQKLAETIFTACSEHANPISSLHAFELAEPFKDELAALNDRRVKLHSSFARKGRSANVVKAGIKQVVRLEESGLKSDIRDILSRWPDLTEEDYDRLVRLKAQLSALNYDELDEL